MQTATPPSTRKAWANAIAQPATEIPLTPLPILSGRIPQGLRGSLYRNGPARLERGGQRMGHWFDGDGAILAVHFTDATATGVYRYVQTSAYQEEAAAGTLLYPNYGTKAAGRIWERWGKPVKNRANTSVLPLPDKLLALWEGGNPYALDLQTLETWGRDRLDYLGEGDSFSAHPKCDPETGEIFNFGISLGLNSSLNLYKSDSTGKIIQKGTIPLKGIPLVHDFVLAGSYLVFFVPPVRVNLLPAALGVSSFGEAMEWRPQLGTQILIVDRETLSLVARSEADPWFQWHFANGYVNQQGSIVVEFIRYPDFGTNQRLQEIAMGEIHTVTNETLWQVEINPQTGMIIAERELLDRYVEFPVVPDAQVGQTSRSIYLALHRQDMDHRREIYSAIARFDCQTQTLIEADLGKNRYPSEPIHAPDALNPEQGWVLTVVYDGNSNQSEVWIYDSDALDQEPACRLQLPQVIPLSFHGRWKSVG